MSVPANTLEVARAHLAAGRVAEAEAACTGLLQQNDADVHALHLLALIRAQTGRLADGATLLERVVALAPDSPAARSDLGAMLIMLKRPEAAEVQLRAAVALNPGSVEARLHLGNALHARGEFKAAEEIYRAALQADPRHVRGLMSLGNLLHDLRRPAEALEFLSAAAGLAPGVAAAHLFLGNCLRDLGRADEVIASYRRALLIEPQNADVNENLGHLLMAQGHFAEAIICFRASGTHYARALALECELRLGRTADFFAWIESHKAGEATNLHLASLSAYAAWHLGRPDPHPFCPDPLSQVRVVELYTAPGDADFLQALIREGRQLAIMWEPYGVTTKQGFQSGGNIFAHGYAALARLQADLIEQLQRYRAALAPAGMALAERWPARMQLQGWFVRLLTGGHQQSHNHPIGWMSGCLYLQMPAKAAPGEGAIEFSLDSGGYPQLSDRPGPTVVHQPKPGQLALFPSSAYHRTIPFSSDEERLCIAFDLLPG
ncbi:MAG: tetratricopeptide repeat protein [Gammaproteobacteria bacterium]|nr:tetratricopeptide repeat protein [Gammaproteobacteria bacterium]